MRRFSPNRAWGELGPPADLRSIGTNVLRLISGGVRFRCHLRAPTLLLTLRLFILFLVTDRARSPYSVPSERLDYLRVVNLSSF